MTTAFYNDPNKTMDTKYLDRKNLGPMVTGFVKAMLHYIPTIDNEDIGEFTVDDVTERLLVSICTKCVQFYWRNRYDLEALWASGEYTEFYAGKDFALSCYGLEGFLERGTDPVYERLHRSANVSFEFWPTAVVDGQIDMAPPVELQVSLMDDSGDW